MAVGRHNCQDRTAAKKTDGIQKALTMKEAVQITLQIKEIQQNIQVPPGRTLLEIFQDQGIFLTAVCAGKGICGKCRVRFLEGAAEPSGEDERFFTREELEEGWRLACQTYPQKDCVVAARQLEENFLVMADTSAQIRKQSDREECPDVL